MQAIAANADNVICISNDAYNNTIFSNVYMVSNPSQAATLITPPLAKTCGGAAYIGGEIAIAIKDANGGGKIATFSVPQPAFSYIDVPELYTRLFSY